MARKLNTLQDLYLDELRDLYNAETQLVNALPDMAEAAQSEELREAFASDIERTQEHIQRLQQIFADCGQNPLGRQCKGMSGLIEEGLEMTGNGTRPSILDAALVVTAQKAQHYEIAGYGSAATFAHILGRDKDEELLLQTMEEEKLVDSAFTNVANRTINQAAAVA